MTQSIVVQVGQCGNQIGYRFWDLALREHALLRNPKAFKIDESSLWSFFRPTLKKDAAGEGTEGLQARAVMIDMEEGVLNSLMREPLGPIFSSHQLLSDVSGSGNNWAVGFHCYGKEYREKIVDLIRREAEFCDCLQCFFLIHSLGGGTGSGLGTAVLSEIRDEFPKVFKYVTSVFPSALDDVVTSPYNTVLALQHVTESADCSIPVENQALVNICKVVTNAQHSKTSKGNTVVNPEGTVMSSEGSMAKKIQERPFDQMNNIVANLLLNLTSSSRFPGNLNVDLNDICTSLVPYPKLHYLVSSLTPLYSILDSKIPLRSLDQMFSDAFSANHQLIECEPKKGIFLACAFLARGNVSISDVRRNVDRLHNGLNFISWNSDGWKTGLCAAPPVGYPYSLLTLSNNTCMRHTFDRFLGKFNKLYKKKAHVHHFLQVDGMESEDFNTARESLTDISGQYYDLEGRDSDVPVPRIKITL